MPFIKASRGGRGRVWVSVGVGTNVVEVGRVGDEGGFGTSGGVGGLGSVGVDDGDGAVTACEVVGACVITIVVSCGLGAEAEASFSVGA